MQPAFFFLRGWIQDGDFHTFHPPGGWSQGDSPVARLMKQMTRHNIAVVCASVVSIILLTAITLAGDPQSQCGLHVAPQHLPSLDEFAGKHMTARGTLRILLVFASFPDDETPHPYWPAHQPPLFMNNFVDPDTLVRSTQPFNLTHYFREMSLGQYALLGDVLWVESTRSQSEYATGSYGRANTDIIHERLDSLVDFSQYDRWTRVADYRNVNIPDGVVDMIVMVWRTTLFGYLGEASLGYKEAISVDGKRIEMGFPESFVVSQGSGVTCEYPYGDEPGRAMQTMAHELGHWLLGGLHPYSTQLAGKHQYWGILCAGERLSSCMNAYERERLGWISVPEIEPDSDLSLSDYVRTGAALKYHPANGDPLEFFYMENHQRLSAFDDATLNPVDRGVWILHQRHPYLELDNLRIKPSDGNWEWEQVGTNSACFGQEVPVFSRGSPRVVAGDSHRDQIPTQSSAVNWMHAFKGDTGSVECGVFFGGESFSGAYDTSSSTVFSPYSNPSSNSWSGQPTTFTLEVLRVTNGVAVVRSSSDPLASAPARRYLGIDPLYTDSLPGVLPLAWGTEWSDGQPLEADFASSTLQRKTGNESWETVYQGPVTRWIDRNFHYDSAGSRTVAFRVRVHDKGGKLSNWSNVVLARASGFSSIAVHDREAPVAARLENCYPNPCNPATTIQFSIVEPQFATLRVYDLLGREVAVLVNEPKEPGRYTVRFDVSGLASGVYCYILQGRPLRLAPGRDPRSGEGSRVQAKRLIVLR